MVKKDNQLQDPVGYGVIQVLIRPETEIHKALVDMSNHYKIRPQDLIRYFITNAYIQHREVYHK